MYNGISPTKMTPTMTTKNNTPIRAIKNGGNFEIPSLTSLKYEQKASHLTSKTETT